MARGEINYSLWDGENIFVTLRYAVVAKERTEGGCPKELSRNRKWTQKCMACNS